MQILAISGSKNRKGKTAQAINAIFKGAAKAGGNSESIFLTELAIERCRQCNDDGWGICRNDGMCVIEDDFASIAEKVMKADVVVFANPVYFGDLSESIKTFLDRYRRTHAFRRPAGGAPGMPPMGGGGIPAIGLCYAGGSGNGTITCAASMERVLQMCGFDLVDMILARRQNLEVKLPILEAVGKWLVTKPTSGPWPPPPPAK